MKTRDEKDKLLYPYKNYYPQIDQTVFIAPGAKIIGQVSVGAYSSVWYNAVIRGDIGAAITIGKYTNIQDNSVIHVARNSGTMLGDYITVGHGVILHNCQIENNCLIGMGAIILNHSSIGENSLIAAGALIPERKKIPPNSLVMGSPGKVVREVTPEEIEYIRGMAESYNQERQEYLSKLEEV